MGRLKSCEHGVGLPDFRSNNNESGQFAGALQPPKESAVNRFLRYVQIDTQSQYDVPTVPSTTKQFDLANLLAGELKILGAQDVRITDNGIIYARIPGNMPANTAVPVLGLMRSEYRLGSRTRAENSADAIGAF